jgi:hypothetical protein
MIRPHQRRLRLFCIVLSAGGCVASVRPVAAAPKPTGTIEAGAMRITFDERGVGGIAHPQDPHGAVVVPTNQRLGLTVRYRALPPERQTERRRPNPNESINEKESREAVAREVPAAPTEWRVLPADAVQYFPTPDEKELIYAVPVVTELPVRVIQRFRVEEGSLTWTVELVATSEAPVEIGDLAVVVPWQGPGGGDPAAIFERGFTKHQFVAGHGSFIYFTRASGTPPYLVVTPMADTPLEYFGNVGGQGGGSRGGNRGGNAGGNPTGGRRGRGASGVFVHSAVAGEAVPQVKWRQGHTSKKLNAAGAEGDRVLYGFRFQFADSYDGLRDVLHRENLLDVRVVPGMTVPRDLSARVAIRTQGEITALEPEFPDSTKVTKQGEPRDGYQVYEVQFTKLGENMLTVRREGDRNTRLEFFVTEPLETLIKKRAAFIVNHQQHRDVSKWYNGLFSVYDMKNGILRSPEDTDEWRGREEYIVASDDPALPKAPYVASKNVHFPDQQEIAAVEYYLENYVWGKMQRTDKETPYPYGVYGIPNWWVQRDPERKRTFETRADLEEKMRVWRPYDYAHVTMLYYHMYEIAKLYPTMVKHTDAAGYLERAYQTARGFYLYGPELIPADYETYTFGVYNELIILKLIDALEREGRQDAADWLRAEWEKKVKYFVYDHAYPYSSEYAFDRTAFESTYALAKYGATHDMKPDEKLWYSKNQEKWFSHPQVQREDSRAFMDRQLLANLAVRGWLDTAFFTLGADYTRSSDSSATSYMAQMGGWGILDYGVNFASKPDDWLQLGYASYVGAWCLMNTGTPETNYGYWYPGPEKDGATGWSFMAAKTGRAWIGKQVDRGPWFYDGEIDLGYGGALRSAATILTRDEIFDWTSYGGTLEAAGNRMNVEPRDGLRKRFYIVVPTTANDSATYRRLKIELERDGFAAGQKITVDRSWNVAFDLENRTGDAHTTALMLSLPEGESYVVRHNGSPVALTKTGNWDYPLRAELKVGDEVNRVELLKQ